MPLPRGVVYQWEDCGIEPPIVIRVGPSMRQLTKLERVIARDRPHGDTAWLNMLYGDVKAEAKRRSRIVADKVVWSGRKGLVVAGIEHMGASGSAQTQQQGLDVPGIVEYKPIPERMQLIEARIQILRLHSAFRRAKAEEEIAADRASYPGGGEVDIFGVDTGDDWARERRYWHPEFHEYLCQNHPDLIKMSRFIAPGVPHWYEIRVESQFTRICPFREVLYINGENVTSIARYGENIGR